MTDPTKTDGRSGTPPRVSFEFFPPNSEKME